jgi:hypothetical protein
VTVGKIVASVLRESWRPAPPVFSGSDEELGTALPILIATGSAGLAWWKLSRSGDTRFCNAGSPVVEELRDAFRTHSLQAALHDRDIRNVFDALLTAGLNPILVKGWSVARSYAVPALRPYGDIDLCVDDCETASQVLRAKGLGHCNVDLHAGGQHLIDVPFADVVAQSCLIDLEGMPIRIPSPEHHLRILCLHLLYHGAWRPLWLCDIGAAIERIDNRFRWESFLGSDSVRAGWIACTVRLAESALGADLSRVPEPLRQAVLPRWFERSVLREWARSHRWTSARPVVESIARRPWTAPYEIMRRWPDPIRASVAFHAPFDRGWRAPYQLRYGLARIRSAAGQLWESRRH